HLITDSQEIANGIYWGGNFENTAELINKEIIGGSDIRFFLGYSGWGSNQLDQELVSKSWIVADNHHESGILEKSAIAFWKERMLELGGTIYSGPTPPKTRPSTKPSGSSVPGHSIFPPRIWPWHCRNPFFGIC